MSERIRTSKLKDEPATKKPDEKKSFRRELILSAFVAVIAVLVNIIMPVNLNVWSIGEKRSNAEGFLKRLDSTSLTEMYAAANYVANDSPAATYTDIMARLWRAEYDYRGIQQDRTIDVPKGAVTESDAWPFAMPSLRLCSPHVRNLPYGKCVSTGSFSFDEHNKITKFSINGLPIDKLMLQPDLDSGKTNIVMQDRKSNEPKANKALRAYYGGAIIDPDLSHASLTAVLYPSDSNRREDVLIDQSDISTLNRNGKVIKASVSVPWKVPNYSHVVMSARFPTSGDGFIRLNTKLVVWDSSQQYDQSSAPYEEDWLNITQTGS